MKRHLGSHRTMRLRSGAGRATCENRQCRVTIPQSLPHHSRLRLTAWQVGPARPPSSDRARLSLRIALETGEETMVPFRRDGGPGELVIGLQDRTLVHTLRWFLVSAAVLAAWMLRRASAFWRASAFMVGVALPIGLAGLDSSCLDAAAGWSADWCPGGRRVVAAPERLGGDEKNPASAGRHRGDGRGRAPVGGRRERCSGVARGNCPRRHLPSRCRQRI